MKRWLFILALLLFASEAQATTYVAASCSQADIAAAMALATSGATGYSDGDTVSVPAGTCTWTTAVTVSKNITIQGAGTASTIITCQVSSCVNLGTSKARITAIWFKRDTGTSNVIYSQGQNFRVDNNKITNLLSTSCNALQAAGDYPSSKPHPTGVFDHNTVNDCRVIVLGDLALLANTIWFEASKITTGAEQTGVVYIETNTFDLSGVSLDVSDCNYGGRIVFRYNTVTNSYGEVHSVQGNNRACRSWEFYSNTLTRTSSFFTCFNMRGGTGVLYSNTCNSNYSAGIRLDNRRSFESFSTSGSCDGSNVWDENVSTGYPCRDQIGRGVDVSLWSDTTSPYSPAPPAQTDEPAYFWLNTKGGSNTSPTVVNCGSAVKPTGSCQDIVADRDYFTYTATFDGTSGVGSGVVASRPATCTAGASGAPGVGYWATDENKLYRCTATNTWTHYYSPSTYPHSLVGSAGAGVASLVGNGAFADTIVDSSTDNSFTLSNTGGTTFDITSILEDSSHFSIQSNTCGATLAASASCTFAVRFTPTTVGAKTATLTVTTSVNDPTSSLSGTGTALPVAATNPVGIPVIIPPQGCSKRCLPK